MANKQPNENSQKPDETIAPELPPGVKLVRTLRGHTDHIGRIAWSPDGRMIASPSADNTIRLWDAETGECLRTLKGHAEVVYSVAFDPAGRILASGSQDKTVKLWDVYSGQLLRTFKGHKDWVWGIDWSPDGKALASTARDKKLLIWNAGTGIVIHRFDRNQWSFNNPVWSKDASFVASANDKYAIRLCYAANGLVPREFGSHEEDIFSIAIDPQGRTLASVSEDKTVKLWEVDSGHLLRSLEGHIDSVNCVAFLFDGRLVCSKACDGTFRLWCSNTGVCVGIVPEPALSRWSPGLAFHPRLPLLATVGSDSKTPEYKYCRLIHIWELDVAVLLGQAPVIQTSHYINAKAVLLGDTGVGKSGLSMVLNGEPFAATDSTPGRKVWTFQSQEVEVSNNLKQTRETLLWDLAGQPGYRVIHQLHLNEVAVALVVFDARSEVDPLAGVRHWERALRLAQQRQGTSLCR